MSTSPIVKRLETRPENWRRIFPVKLSHEERRILALAQNKLGVSAAEIIRYSVFRVYLPSVLKYKDAEKYGKGKA